MSTNGNLKLLIAGYPKAGKTTYLAALWYVLNHTDELDAGLRLHKLEGNDVYLNKIQDQWLGYQEVERTKLSQEKAIFFEVRDLKSGKVIGLSFPDLSGERFDDQFEQRHCFSDFADLVTRATGCLVFIHSGQMTKSVSIASAEPAIDILKSQSDVKGLDKDTHIPEKPVPWNRTMPCIQVKTIELLQFIAYLRGSVEPIRLAVVISAWDLVESHHKTPSAFLEKHLPFLHQFLAANTEIFCSGVFGISATGVDLSKENRTNVQIYAAKIYKHTDRIKVKFDDDETPFHDLTLPIKWVL
jgi:hypothetical protein